ncbi:UDP-N-acetylglucosamine 2-epimerase [Candidatus Woesearchaeota archaeon]|nr:UDP-N-acetylglucosamine 2-epimerase [Candidatus Woesearchaeota archaeon]
MTTEKGNYDNYESMFGAVKNIPEEIRVETKQESHIQIVPKYLPMSINESLIKETMEKAQKEKKWVLVFVIGTKPCFYKFYGSIVEAQKQDVPYIIINSNQHYDANLTYGEKEFDYANKIAVNLSIRGNLAQKSAELFTKFSWFANYLKKEWPEITVMPVVLGDTIMCSIVPAAWMFNREEKAIHNEAGLRSMTATCLPQATTLTPEEFVKEQWYGEWKILTNEPFPEQWDTFVASKGSEFMFAPLELNKQHLIREGHPENKIWVTGGVVVEALERKMQEKPTKSIFEIYPQLTEGEWLRVDIHRKENQVEKRFRAIIECMKILLEKGNKICFIEMNTTRDSLNKYNLRPMIEEMKKSKNFLHTEVWPEYANVIEFYNSKHCLAALTDSGGVQEEMNLLGKPCFTSRFNTDRPETVMDSHSNLLVPPISGAFMAATVDYAVKNEAIMNTMRTAKKLYGKEVAKKFISIVKQLMEENRKPFGWAHDDLGYS